MSLDVTIAICAYNAAKRLPATLEALGRMRVPSGVGWELLIIDNRSTDDTAAVARELGERLKLPLILLHEPKPGVKEARRLAAERARGALLCYVDDDTLVAEDWMEALLAFMADHPRAGLIGARIDPLFEDPASVPPDFQKRFADGLAIRNSSWEPRQLIAPREDPPPTAGMVLRTPLARQLLLEIGCQLAGHTGGKLINGEDTEMGLVAQRLGWEVWYAPSLKMQHVLPASRLTEAYLQKLIAEGAQSGPWLDYLRGKEPQRSRLAYLGRAAGWKFKAMRMSLLGKLRSSHEHGAKYPFWARMYHHTALGYWNLARSYPFARLERLLASARSEKGAVTR